MKLMIASKGQNNAKNWTWYRNHQKIISKSPPPSFIKKDTDYTHVTQSLPYCLFVFQSDREHEIKINEQRQKQQELIEQLKSQLEDLETYQYEVSQN